MKELKNGVQVIFSFFNSFIPHLKVLLLRLIKNSS
jgi:hypothetical protein